MNNLVQKLMREQPAEWVKILEGDFKINVVRDGDLVSLKYDQIASPMREPIVQQCRGMVVCVARAKVLAWPYNKFWNHGEALADEIDWSTARVQEKLDGSLMSVYWDGAWCVASSGHPTAGGPFGDEPYTFREAFWRTAAGIRLNRLDRDVTYMLELCAAPNRIVVQHDRPRLVMHGARWMGSGEEASPGYLQAAAYGAGIELVREFPIRSIADCLAAADALDPIQQEGFVVVDSAFRRVKIKSPRYVILHHMKGSATPRRAVELWQSGESAELLAHFPECAPVITPIHDQLDDLARRAADEHDEAMCRSFDRKSYASMASRYPFSSVMFRMLGDGVTGAKAAKAILRRQTTAALERMLGLSSKDA